MKPRPKLVAAVDEILAFEEQTRKEIESRWKSIDDDLKDLIDESCLQGDIIATVEVAKWRKSELTIHEIELLTKAVSEEAIEKCRRR